MTNFLVQRFSGGVDDTLGLLAKCHDVQNAFMCFTLEDEHRTKKVFGETRIPDGVYELKLRTHGGFHERYLEKFDFHIGMIEICDVPNFTDVLIHIGNTDDDTAGCLLVGDSATQNVTREGFIGNSSNAYKRIYQDIIRSMRVRNTFIEFRSDPWL